MGENDLTKPPKPDAIKSIPAYLRVVEAPETFDEIRDRITRRMEIIDDPQPPGATHIFKSKVDVVDGFEDLLNEPLGSGLFYNTSTSAYQLAFVIAMAPHPAVRKVFDNKTFGPKEAVAVFRNKKILSGQKIIDLGCGQLPGFALAARALGATVYTADAVDLIDCKKNNLDGHVLVDLNDEKAADTLRQATGGEFDIVSENIIGGVPRSRVQVPNVQTVLRIGGSLLKKGGCLFHSRTPHGAKFEVFEKL